MISVLHFLLGDLEKKKIKELFDREWPKNTVTSEERERRLKEIRAARATIEKEEEQAIMELETQGVFVDRRPDESPEVFLEWDGNGFNKEKLNEFRRRSLAKHAATAAASQEIADLNMRLREVESLAHHAELAADRERFQKQVAEVRAEQDKLIAKRDALSREYEPTHKLVNRCTSFLRERGIIV